MWYTSIYERIFNEGDKTSHAGSPDSVFSPSMLNWIKANSDARIQNALLDFLLHPHIRSFRTRAALGHEDMRSMVNILEFHPMETAGKDFANVIGVYFILEVPAKTNDGDERKPLGYCGQAMAVKLDDSGSLGIRRRAQEHWKSILKVKSGTGEGSLSAHDRFAEVDQVEITALSVFPSPRATMGDAARHLYYIATLAETIDMFLLDCIDPASGPFARYTGLPHGLLLRPKIVPSRSLKGLNRAIPLKQMQCCRMKISTTWPQREIRSLVQIINGHEDQAYCHFGHSPIN